jgi:hypothetical protein
VPGVFPHVHEVGMRRLRQEFGLVAVEYPTTRQVLPVLPLLNRNVVLADPKPFVGYSGGLYPVSAGSLRAALFTRRGVELHPV